MANGKETIISHLYQNKVDGQWIIQSNDEHQRGVAEMADSFARQFGMGSWGRVLGLLHDKGKERDAFQQYIRKANGLPLMEEKPYGEHHHAFVGGLIVKNIMGKSILNLLVNQIISHHTGLHDYAAVEDILKNQIPAEINHDDVAFDKFLLKKELLESPFSRNNVDMRHFHHLSRMLFSCLVDADRLDTERFMDRESWEKRGCLFSIADLLPKLEAYLQKLQLGL